MLEDKLLVWKLNRGDLSVLRRIYEKYKHDLVTLAAALLNDRSAAEDAVHDTFVAFLQVGRRPQSSHDYFLSLANRRNL